MDVEIRGEDTGDHQAIKLVNDLAFEQPDEGEMIDALRCNPGFVPELSLVALVDDAVVGHILFFPIKIENAGSYETSLSLAPMAVHPDFQGKGIGGRLVEEGIAAAKAGGFESIIVLGHPEYYPRFGFQPASRWGIRPPLEAPDEAFMALELAEGSLHGKAGVVEYPLEYGLAL